MEKNRPLYNQGDWVKVKYGEFKDCLGRISMLEKTGNYIVLPYNEKNEPQAMISLAAESMELIPAFVLSPADFKALLRARKPYDDFNDKIYPPFNVKPEKNYKLKAEDISAALKKISRSKTPLYTFKEWFWLIINVFYMNLNIAERYNEEGLFGIPLNDDEIFSDVYGLTEKLYWRLEERFSKKEDNEKLVVKFHDEPVWDKDALNDDEIEKAAFVAVCEDIIARVDAYKFNKDKPEKEWIYTNGQKKLFIENCLDRNLENISTSELRSYRKFVRELAASDDIQALKSLAWGHYEGDRAFRQNWKLSEKYLKKIFDLSGDPFAANALGYIYYYGRTTNGEPHYEEAFKYFSFGAIAGIDESIYKSGDMLIYGYGTKKNIEMGLHMIVNGYRETLFEFCDGMYDNKFADYALRMGNICRDKLIYGMGMRDAYKFYLEAYFAIKKRRETIDYYGDKSVEAGIQREMEKIQDKISLDLHRKTIKSDYPIYINQLFDDIFPIKVFITKKKNGQTVLSMHRFRLDDTLLKGLPLPDKLKDIPRILVSFPEISYCDLVCKLDYELENVGVIKKPENVEFFLSDGFRKNIFTNAIEFYQGSELVAAVEAEWFIFRKPETSEF